MLASKSQEVSKRSILKYCGCNEYFRLNFVSLLLKYLYKNSKEKIRVLDVGGGGGNLNLFLDWKKFDYFLLDASEENIRIASKKKIKSVVSKGCKIPFRNNSFDAVLCIHVLEHINDEVLREKLCKEFIRVSKGYVILIFPYGKYFKLSEKLNAKLLKKSDKSFHRLLEHFLFKPVNMERIKTIFKDAQIKHTANIFIILMLLLFSYTPPFLKLWFISFFTPLFAFIYKSWPCRDAVIVYHKC